MTPVWKCHPFLLSLRYDRNYHKYVYFIRHYTDNVLSMRGRETSPCSSMKTTSIYALFCASAVLRLTYMFYNHRWLCWLELKYGAVSKKNKNQTDTADTPAVKFRSADMNFLSGSASLMTSILALLVHISLKPHTCKDNKTQVHAIRITVLFLSNKMFKPPS